MMPALDTGDRRCRPPACGHPHPAIISPGDSPSTIKCHSVRGTDARFPVTPDARTASGLRLTWTGGTLQQSDTFNGSYSDVAGSASPFEVSASAAAKFYRLRQ